MPPVEELNAVRGQVGVGRILKWTVRRRGFLRAAGTRGIRSRGRNWWGQHLDWIRKWALEPKSDQREVGNEASVGIIAHSRLEAIL